MLVHCACRITQRQIPIFDIIILFEFLHAYAMSDKINLHMNRILFSNVSFSISCCRYLATKDGFVRVHKQHSCTAMHIAPRTPLNHFPSLIMLSSLVTCRFLCLWLCSALYMRCIYPYGLWIHSQRTGHSFIHRSEKINTRKVLRYEFVVTCFIVLCVACINICICTEFRLELNKKRNNNAVEVKIYIAPSPPPPPPLPPSLDTHICMYEERANSTMITMFSLIEMFV